jgi:hypothetical protein
VGVGGDLPLESRLRFLNRLEEAAGPGGGMGVGRGSRSRADDTDLGDRRASGHSILGLAVFDPALRAEAIGRCRSQGRLRAWLADS